MRDPKFGKFPELTFSAAASITFRRTDITAMLPHHAQGFQGTKRAISLIRGNCSVNDRSKITPPAQMTSIALALSAHYYSTWYVHTNEVLDSTAHPACEREHASSACGDWLPTARQWEAAWHGTKCLDSSQMAALEVSAVT